MAAFSRPGDQVMSYNFETGVWEPQLVIDQWSLIDHDPAATLTLPDTSQAAATADHLVWVETTQQWTEIQHVTIGHDFLTPTGTIELADLSLAGTEPWIVWELTVENNHNFAISTGTQDLLVHNSGYGNAIQVRMTNAEAKAAAAALGYRPVRDFPFNSHGQLVFTDGKNFITPDVDGHKGGVWKKFNRKGQRIGTFDGDLNKICK